MLAPMEVCQYCQTFGANKAGVDKACGRQMQDDSLRGLLHGIYIGVSGVLLKPMSGCLGLLSELCIGASGKIKGWGEDHNKRPPAMRIRPPRQFSTLSATMRGVTHKLSAQCLPCSAASPVTIEAGKLSFQA